MALLGAMPSSMINAFTSSAKSVDDSQVPTSQLTDASDSNYYSDIYHPGDSWVETGDASDPDNHWSGYVPTNSEIRNIIDSTMSNSGKSVPLYDNPNDYFYDLYKIDGDNAWLEKYIDNLVAQANTESARKYETEMSNTAFSRMIADIQNAGYNPWLALQNSSSASTPSVSAAGLSDIGVSSQKTSRVNEEYSSNLDLIGRIISAFGTIFGAAIIGHARKK